MGGIPSWAVTTLSPLVATDLVSVEKCFWWLKSKISRSRLNPRLMFISKAHGMLYSYTENLQEKELTKTPASASNEITRSWSHSSWVANDEM